MALNINILSAIDWTSGLGRKFRRKEGEASTIRETIIVQSNAQFENLVGRFDLSDRVHGYTDKDQQRCAAEIELVAKARRYPAKSGR